MYLNNEITCQKLVIIRLLLDCNTFSFQSTILLNRKVLLRERKRHTARRVDALCPDGGTISGPDGGYPHPVLTGGYPHPIQTGDVPPSGRMGYPLSGRMGITPIRKDRGTPCQWMGYPPPPVEVWNALKTNSIFFWSLNFFLFQPLMPL